MVSARFPVGCASLLMPVGQANSSPAPDTVEPYKRALDTPDGPGERVNTCVAGKA